jgi:hypothetical protein
MSEIVDALGPVVDALVELGVRYRVGGSVASSALGVPRSTLDVDVACELEQGHVARFVERLVSHYYVDADMIIDAIRRRASFNVIHLATMLKVDVFVRKRTPFEEQSFERVTKKTLDETPGARLFDVTTAEDIVLHKLDWYRMGGGVSERQWKDVLGVLAVQAEALDVDHLRRWARAMGVEELLERALAEAATSAGRGPR